MEVNAPILMKHAERLGKILKIPAKEAWNLFDIEFSTITNKPCLDFFKLDHFLAIPEEAELSMDDVLKMRYPEDYDYIVKLIFGEQKKF